MFHAHTPTIEYGHTEVNVLKLPVVTLKSSKLYFLEAAQVAFTMKHKWYIAFPNSSSLSYGNTKQQVSHDVKRNCLQGFRLDRTQTGLHNYKDYLEALPLILCDQWIYSEKCKGKLYAYNNILDIILLFISP